MLSHSLGPGVGHLRHGVAETVPEPARDQSSGTGRHVLRYMIGLSISTVYPEPLIERAVLFEVPLSRRLALEFVLQARAVHVEVKQLAPRLAR